MELDRRKGTHNLDHGHQLAKQIHRENFEQFQSFLKSTIGESAQNVTLCLLLEDNAEFVYPADQAQLSIIREMIETVRSKTEITAPFVLYGYERIAFLFLKMPKSEALSAAEAMRTILSQHEFGLPSRLQRITVSAGIANFPDDELTAEALYDRAEQALSFAIAQGGNQVCDAARLND